MPVEGSDRDDRHVFADKGVRAMLEFTPRVALGVHIRGLLHLERPFTRYGVVDSAAQVQEGGGVAVFCCELCDLSMPRFDLAFNEGGQVLQFSNASLQFRGIERAKAAAFVERKQIKSGQLAGEALGGWDGQ